MTQIKPRPIVKSLIKERGSLRSVARKATTNIVFGIFMAELLKNCKNTGAGSYFPPAPSVSILSYCIFILRFMSFSYRISPSISR